MIESRPERVSLIEQIEERTGSKVVVYFCGDRPVAPSQRGEDAIRYTYDHLLALSSDCNTKNLALFLYSRVGLA
jgi:ethanolamine ammonia-lyase small subunit